MSMTNAADLKRSYPEFDEFKEKSFYVYKSHKPLVNFSENINEGVPFNTPSGKIEIFSKTLYDMNRPEDIPGSPGHIYCAEGPEDPLKENILFSSSPTILNVGVTLRTRRTLS